MAELATVARPYAEALFKSAAAGATDNLDRTAAWLDRLATIASDVGLQQFAANPKATSEQVFELVSGIHDGALSDHAQNFLRIVIENGRLAALPEIAGQFRALKNTLGGSSDATVYSPFPIEASALGEVAQVLERRFGRKLNVTVKQQPELIGGIRVVVGDEVLDTSVKARLEQMKMALSA